MVSPDSYTSRIAHRLSNSTGSSRLLRAVRFCRRRLLLFWGPRRFTFTSWTRDSNRPAAHTPVELILLRLGVWRLVDAVAMLIDFHDIGASPLRSPAADQNVPKNPSWQSLTWTSNHPTARFFDPGKNRNRPAAEFFSREKFSPKAGNASASTRRRFAPITGSKSKAWGGLPPFLALSEGGSAP